MPNSKLQTILDDLKGERKTLYDQADEIQKKISEINQAISSLEYLVGSKSSSSGNGSLPQISFGRTKFTKRRTNIEMVEAVLRDSAKPLHISEIVKEIGNRLDKDVSRGTIETAISRKIKIAGDDSHIKRLGEGMYTLRRKEHDPEKERGDSIFNEYG
ncbi:HTH domain-containing protein [Nitrospina watsonii]|uniref:HTH HARE-type domain-containing protein n=1 Tax=Nitrospina watsonii TaxID=1323948 RepID=A0ABN8VZ54_9BACT|nr:HTH domain-containing protein [Nitrospina watsonii]CAI2719044.1 protein of unknown function [Nitrospina watsonii]